MAEATDISARALAYSVPQAAKRTNLPETKLWRAIRDKQLKSFKLGRSRRVSEGALVAFVRELERRSE